MVETRTAMRVQRPAVVRRGTGSLGLAPGPVIVNGNVGVVHRGAAVISRPKWENYSTIH
jgi:hypothetical protein